MTQHSVTLGIDVGDRHSHLCLLDTKAGEIVEESRIATNPVAFERRFSNLERMRVVVEAGTHSPWIGRVLRGCGHELLVANARKLRLIYADRRKNDRLDAENLARLARLDPRLLSPIEHRGEASQAHLAIVRSREALVGARTKLVNHVRGSVKSFGSRLPKCNAESFHHKVREHVPDALTPALEPLLGDHLLAHRAHPLLQPSARGGLTRALPGDRPPQAGAGGRTGHGAVVRAGP